MLRIPSESDIEGNDCVEIPVSKIVSAVCFCDGMDLAIV